ncbi:MAG TPA: group 1 truncated hemoglobin [Pyrinomonadaceae bacterium]|nr:group 1 truncated hemoglobin [Pyrinomonadaceae bacterium]
MTKRIALTLCLLVALATVAGAQALQTSTPASVAATHGAQEKKSLYARVGGYDALALVVDDFIKRLATDPKFAKFFSGFSVDSQKRLRQHILDQFCKAAGGPCEYIGRDMKTTHTGLGITEAEWDAAAKHLVAAMDKYKVPQAEKDELMAFVGTQKKDIVEKP